MLGDDFLVDKYNRFLPQYAADDTLSLRAGGVENILSDDMIKREALITLYDALITQKAIPMAEAMMRAMWEVEPIG